MEKHNKELQILRGVALCAVVGIHTLSIGIKNTQIGTLGNWLFELVHTLLQFAVPCFIFISAILLSYPLKNKNLNVVEFYKKKIIKIVIPYLLWTLIYLIPQMMKGWIPFDRLVSFKSWLYWLTRGKAYDHLYFMSIIIQLYFVAPLLLILNRVIIKYAKRYSMFATLSIGISGQAAFYYFYKLYISRIFNQGATLIISYFFIVMFGIWIGFKYEQFWELIIKKRRVVLILFGISTIIYLGFMIQRVLGEKLNSILYQFAWYGYTLMTSITLLMASYAIKKYRLSKYIVWIGKYSFGIYLIHPIQTFFLRKIIQITNPVLLIILLVIVQVGIILSCGWFVKICLKCRFTSILFGRIIEVDRCQKRELSCSWLE